MGSEEVDLVRLERLAKEMGPREKGEMSWLSKGRTRAGRAVCVSRSVMSDSLQHCGLPPDSSVHGIFQARILEWVAIPFFGDLSDPRIEPRSPALQADSLPSELPGKPMIQFKC